MLKSYMLKSYISESYISELYMLKLYITEVRLSLVLTGHDTVNSLYIWILTYYTWDSD